MANKFVNHFVLAEIKAGIDICWLTIQHVWWHSSQCNFVGGANELRVYFLVVAMVHLSIASLLWQLPYRMATILPKPPSAVFIRSFHALAVCTSCRFAKMYHIPGITISPIHCRARQLNWQTQRHEKCYLREWSRAMDSCSKHVVAVCQATIQ